MATEKLCVTFKVVELRVGGLGSRTRVDTINFKGETDLSMGQLREMLSEILLAKKQEPVALATGVGTAWSKEHVLPQPVKDPRVRTCDNPDCKRSFVAHSSTQRFCGKKECRQWGKTHPAKRYKKRGVEYKQAEPWKSKATVAAGIGVTKGSVTL
jgi:hypothetical protein